MSLLTTLLSSSGGGGSGSNTGVILSPVIAASTSALLATYANGSNGVGATLTNANAYLTDARVATTGALTVTYANGTAGVGATLTNAGAQAALSIDSVTLSVNDRVLVKNQASTLQNGVYSVTDVGSGSTNWILTRVTDFDAPSEMVAGTQISITAGTTNINTKWILSATVSAVGTDPVTFTATAAITLDGISPTVGQRVLIKNQTSTLQNGIYTVTTVGSATADWVLTRATDFDEPSEILPGVLVEVSSGTINDATVWEQSSTVTAVGTDAITFTATSVGGLTASRAVITDANGKLTTATTTATEIGYVNGVTSAIQTQLGTKFSSVVTQVFTGSGTYTPTSGMKYCIIECIGGGGGGGGTATGAASTLATGAGGGGGGYSRKLSTAATISTSQTVTIGAAGTAGTSGNNNGGNGGDTSVGSICIGKGGSGGIGNAGNTSPLGGAGGIAGTGDFTVPGQAGVNGIGTTVTAFAGVMGGGGNAALGFGYGGVPQTASPAAGNAAQNYGAGGSGGQSFNGNGAAAGGAGTAGIVIITEFI